MAAAARQQRSSRQPPHSTRARRRPRAAAGALVLLLVLLAAAGCCRPAAALYHTSSELLHWFSHCSAKRPELMRFRELHEHRSGMRMPVATITAGLKPPPGRRGAGGVSTAAAAAPHGAKPAVVFVFGEHAREVITSEVGIWLARLLINPNSSAWEWPELADALERARVDERGASTSNATRDPSTDAVLPPPGGSDSSAASSTTTNSSSSSGGGGGGAASGGQQQQHQQQQQQPARDWAAIGRAWVQQLLAQLEVVIVPIEALDSRRMVEAGQLCVRKNAANVDLNRNWPHSWQQAGPGDEQYGGAGPLSEPQSRLMKHLFDHLGGRLLGYVNMHSGEWALYTPWDSREGYGPGLPSDLPDLVAKVGRLCDCTTGPAGAVSGYLAHGTSMDYLYAARRVPYPLTVEVYGGGGEGRLRPGQDNRPLAEWPVLTSKGAPTSADAAYARRQRRAASRRRSSSRALHQQQHQQEQPGDEDAGGGGGGAHGSSGAGGSAQHDSLAAAAWRLLSRLPWRQRMSPLPQQQQQQQPAEQQQEQQRRRLAQQQQHLGGDIGAVDAAAADAGGPSSSSDAPLQAPGTFTAGGNLQQLRQQAAAAAGQQQQQAAPPDALLAAVAAAESPLRGCWDAFNPTSEAEYRRVVADWLAASLIMLRHMADSSEAARISRHTAATASLRGSGGVGTAVPLGGSRGVRVSSVSGSEELSAAGRGLLASRGGQC